MGQLLEQLEKVAPTPGRAKGALNTWALIKTLGYTQAKESTNYSTWRKHVAMLQQAGLSHADLCAGTVLEFRRKSLVLGQHVNSWEELRRAA